MKAVAYRLNRETYGALLGFAVAIYIVLISFMEKPPGAEVPFMFLLVPRLHDLGYSGWWALSLVALEIVFLGSVLLMGGSEAILIWSGLFVIAALLGLIVVALIPGEKGSNRWGDAPPRGIQWKRSRQ